jgi:hypothetical protein
MELAGAYNIALGHRFFENLCNLGLDVPPISILLTVTSYSISLVRIKGTKYIFHYMTQRKHPTSLGMLTFRSMFAAP